MAKRAKRKSRKVGECEGLVVRSKAVLAGIHLGSCSNSVQLARRHLEVVRTISTELDISRQESKVLAKGLQKKLSYSQNLSICARRCIASMRVGCMGF